MQNQSPATNHHNTHQDSQHNKHKTQTSTRPRNVNSFLTNNPQILNELEIHFNFNRDETILKENNINYYYKYDINRETREELNRDLLKFIIDLIYYNETEEKKIKIYLLSQFLINSKFKPYFKIMTKGALNNNLYIINDMYYYLISGGKKKNPFINIDKININTDHNILKNCLCCFNEYSETQTNKKISCINCLNLEICISCFDRLENPKKCPLCRSPHINKIEFEGERQIKYIYNNKSYIETIKYNIIDDDELLLIFLGYDERGDDKIKICSHIFNITDEKKLMNDFFNNIDETILYYNVEFLFNLMINQYNDIIDIDIFKSIIEGCQTRNNANPIMKILGLRGPDEAEENKINFYENLINGDGLQHAHNKEFLLKIGRDREADADIYLFSDNSNISQWSINPQYFKNNYQNISNQTNIYNFDSLFYLRE
jgi:hypothetical protein